MRDQLFKILFSTRVTALLFILYPTAMAFGTFIESWYSTDTAKIWIYNAWWFEVIMVFMAINFIGNIFKYRLLRKEKWAVLMIHLSFLSVSYTHLRAHETGRNLVCRLLLEKKKNKTKKLPYCASYPFILFSPFYQKKHISLFLLTEKLMVSQEAKN